MAEINTELIEEEIKTELIAIDKLTPDKRNARKHTSRDIHATAKSIELYGFNDPVGVWGKHNLIVEGHGRVEAGKALGMTKVPCIRLDHLTAKQRREYAIMHNKTAELSEWDYSILGDELKELELDDFGDIFYEEPTEAQKSREWLRSGDKGHATENDSDEYKAFTEKFEEKHTTDDCYTPEPIYNAVADYVAERYNLDKAKFVRPFYPGGDYQRYEYAHDSVVVDNPPFSIMSEIVSFYIDNGIKFFLFIDHRYCGSVAKDCVTCIIASATVTYSNGAKVNTSFITNMEPETRLRVDGELYHKLKAINDELRHEKAQDLEKYAYPPEVVTGALLGKFAKHRINVTIPADECAFIRKLDCHGNDGGLFGGGWLISERLAQERLAQERLAQERLAQEQRTVLELSEREREIVKSLSKK